jgi:hypothetical protein
MQLGELPIALLPDAPSVVESGVDLEGEAVRTPCAGLVALCPGFGADAEEASTVQPEEEQMPSGTFTGGLAGVDSTSVVLASVENGAD